MALGCKELDIPLIYVSTGAVFDGEKQDGYTELDMPNPLSVYGKSKLKGEEIVASTLKKYFIVRAGWMIGGYQKDKKFVWKIIQLLKTKKSSRHYIFKLLIYKLFLMVSKYATFHRSASTATILFTVAFFCNLLLT